MFVATSVARPETWAVAPTAAMALVTPSTPVTLPVTTTLKPARSKFAPSAASDVSWAGTTWPPAVST